MTHHPDAKKPARAGLLRAAIAIGLAAASAMPLAGAEWRMPASHPRLFICSDELPTLRAACGVAATQDASATTPGFGIYHAELQRLKEVAAELVKARAGWDDLYVPAILHLVTGQPQTPDAYTRYVAAELTHPSRQRIGIDGLAALDWCWDALEPATRQSILGRLRDQVELFDDRQSPLDHEEFSRRLESMAAAVVLNPGECRDHASLLGRLELIRLDAARYFETAFPRFCRERGVMPTSPASGIQEEADIVLACELWRCATGKNLLKELRTSAGRMLEHYFYADTEHPALAHGFIHDDGAAIPLRPGGIYRGFAPAVPFVLARYAGDPVAAWYAMRSLPLTAAMSLEADRYLWVKLLYGTFEARPAPRKAMPLGRNFGGGWVAMRSGWRPGDTVVLFDAGQPFWRSRQHFDAGQFQIYRRGRLAIDSGDDAAFQAVIEQGGRTLVGGAPGDWENFSQATIAHNCITVVDQRFVPRHYGRAWPAIGNQRLIERSYVPGEGPIADTLRHTGTLTAFETNSFYSYAAADLGPAYPPEVVRSMSREILLVHAGVVLVRDRLETVKPAAIRTWHLQLPARPVLIAGTSPPTAGTAAADAAGQGVVSPPGGEAVSGRSSLLPEGSAQAADRDALTGARQAHGIDDSAGIWELDAPQTWVQVTHGEGRLFVRTLLPVDADRRLVGGPMEVRTIGEGSMAGRPYVGGAPFGYEYRLWPASFLKAPNASYELGRPVGLGPQFGVGAAWGRYEASPPGPQPVTTFLHVLIPTDAAVAGPPPLRFESSDDAARLELTLGDQAAVIDLWPEGGGQISIRSALTGEVLFEKELATQVEE